MTDTPDTPTTGDDDVAETETPPAAATRLGAQPPASRAVATVTAEDGWALEAPGAAVAAPRLATALRLLRKRPGADEFVLTYQIDAETDACGRAAAEAAKIAERAVADAEDFRAQWIRRLAATPGVTSADIAEITGLSVRAVNAHLAQ